MSDQEIKALINIEIINRMEDGSAAQVLKNIIYNDNNKIDWQDAYKMMLVFMPELQLTK